MLPWAAGQGAALQVRVQRGVKERRREGLRLQFTAGAGNALTLFPLEQENGRRFVGLKSETSEMQVYIHDLTLTMKDSMARANTNLYILLTQYPVMTTLFLQSNHFLFLLCRNRNSCLSQRNLLTRPLLLSHTSCQSGEQGWGLYHSHGV